MFLMEKGHISLSFNSSTPHYPLFLAWVLLKSCHALTGYIPISGMCWVLVCTYQISTKNILKKYIKLDGSNKIDPFGLHFVRVS